MRLLAQLQTADIGRFKNHRDFALYNSKFRNTIEGVDGAVETFRKHDNKPEDGNRDTGKVVLDLFKPHYLSGSLNDSGNNVSMSAKMSGYRMPHDYTHHTLDVSYKADNKTKTWTVSGWQDEPDKIVVEDLTQGTTSLYTNEPEPPRNPVWSLLGSFGGWLMSFFSSPGDAAPPKKTLQKVLDQRLGHQYRQSFSYNVNRTGNFSSPEEVRAQKIRTDIDAGLKDVRKAYLSFDNRSNDGNSSKGYVVLDREAQIAEGPYKNWKADAGFVSNVDSDETRMTGSLRGRYEERLFDLAQTPEETFGLLGQSAYLENRETGDVTVYTTH